MDPNKLGIVRKVEADQANKHFFDTKFTKYMQ